jgi:hypothetical protein
MLRNLGIAIGFLWLTACTAQAGVITADFIFAEQPPGSTTVALPVFMNGSDDLTFLKFGVDMSEISAINSFEIDVNVFDDGDGGGESADIEFAQPSTNISLGSFTNLNGTTEGSPLTLSFFLTPDQIAQVLPTMADGNFRIRIQRNTGDFYLAGGDAILDITPTPEPSTWFMAAGGVLVLGLFMRRRKLTQA